MNTELKTYIGGLVMVFTLLFTAIATANTDQEWRFRVYLDDKEIGYHEFRLIPEGQDGHRLESDARFDVKFLFVTAYSYRHRNTELWQDQCLQQIESETDANGEEYLVRGQLKADGFELAANAQTETINGCVRSFAYWDPSILQSERLLNAQTGELVEVDVIDLGEGNIEVNGDTVSARHYRLQGDGIEIDLWYATQNDRWLALQTTTESGRKLNYRIN